MKIETNLDPLKACPENIWQYRQNLPRLVIRDIIKIFGLNGDAYKKLQLILMARGINKWLECRKDIIKLKGEIKQEIKAIHVEIIKYPRNSPQRKKLVGKLEGLVSIRKRIRIICHSKRWRSEETIG